MTTLYDLLNRATITTYVEGDQDNKTDISFFNGNTVITFTNNSQPPVGKTFTFSVDKDIKNITAIVVGGGKSGSNVNGGSGGKIAVLTPGDKFYKANDKWTIVVGAKDLGSTLTIKGDITFKVPSGDNKITLNINDQNGGTSVYTKKERNNYKDLSNDWNVKEYSGGKGGTQGKPGTDSDIITINGQLYQYGGGGGGGGPKTGGGSGKNGSGGGIGYLEVENEIKTPGSGGGGGSSNKQINSTEGGPGIVVIILEYAGQLVTSSSSATAAATCTEPIDLYPFSCPNGSNSNTVFETNACLNALINIEETNLLSPYKYSVIKDAKAHIMNQNVLSLYNTQYISNMKMCFGIVVISAILAKMMFNPIHI